MNFAVASIHIARIELRRGVASGRWLAVALLWLIATGLSLAVLVAFTRSAQVQLSTTLTSAGADAAGSVQQIQAGKRAAIGALTGQDTALADMLAAWPVVLLVAFKAVSRLLPALAALVGFDLMSSDLSSRTVRFFCLRVSRPAIVVGKYLALTLVLSVLTVLTTSLTAAAAGLAAPEFGAAALFTAWLQTTFAALVEVFTYAALTLLCSTLVRHGALAWVLNIGALFSLWLTAVVGESLVDKTELAALRFASVWHFTQDLVNPSAQSLAIAVAAHGLWGAAFLGLCAWVMSKRSLS